jgi:hypothetical protein
MRAHIHIMDTIMTPEKRTQSRDSRSWEQETNDEALRHSAGMLLVSRGAKEGSLQKHHDFILPSLLELSLLSPFSVHDAASG